jgi:bzd-type benzoyl-CoA reductase Q subunit
MAQEYWRWPESRWTSKDIDWKKAKHITAGIDIGAVSSQAVVMCDGQVFCYSNLRTTPDIADSAKSSLDRALEGTRMELKNIGNIAATGYASSAVSFAQKTENEIYCHVKGSRFMYGPSVRTVVDLGGQTSKAVKLYEKGTITDFAVNDKCATSIGLGIELMADLMHVPVQEIGNKSLAVKDDPEPVSTTCYVFANTEAMGLLRAGLTEEEVMASYLFAIAWRLYALIGRIKPEKDIVFTGGLAKNPGIVRRLERELGLKALTSQYDPQLAGAIGAALIAGDI